MFLFKKKITECILNAPVNGTSMNIEEVPDEIFAKKMMGDGVAFRYEEDTVYAPCKGEVILIANTKHAVGMRSENGMEILIHVGLDTVNLNGKGFTMLVTENSKVKQGQPLLQLDRAFMDEQNIDLTTSMVITNTSEYQLTFAPYAKVTIHDQVMKSVKK